MDQSETELAALLADDLYQHYGQLVLRYQHLLYSFALRLTGSRQDAEDIVQEAFLRAYASLLHFSVPRLRTLKLRPWLYKITLNTFRQYTRTPQFQALPLGLSEQSPALELPEAELAQPEILYEAKEQQAELEQLVASLPARYRVAIACYYFEQMSYSEIAELLDQPLGTVKSTVSRGTKVLRETQKSQHTERRAF
ncbi:MAG TPA: RNA polymerase sigma factor [Ktedonobacteraceae bacterium]|nr:RNA polymerase sigma factor [Ktedonobacteraceae bacterium]